MEIVHPENAGGSLDSMTPAEIVEKLNEYIIGQNDAKRAVAVAIRNRWRRQQLSDDMRKEVVPKNILMMGPTGVGKTEVARRLADMVNAPFVKVEASKYTEVGYHGRDVESMIRDLVKLSINQVQSRAMVMVTEEAQKCAEDRVLDLLLPMPEYMDDPEELEKAEERATRTREKLRKKLQAGELNDRMVEISAPTAPPVAGIIGSVGGDDMALEMQDMMSQMMPGRRKDRRVNVGEAMRVFVQEEGQKLLDDEAIAREGIERAEQCGIVFIDEVDKILGSQRSEGPDVSREGVQRDLLPIVEGCSVATKYGVIKTDHILFIAAGAFHGTKPADLIPELQGRFPIRVELQALTESDFEQILTHPKNALTKQYKLLMGAEDLDIEFPEEGLKLLAKITAQVNQSSQDIGARRLHTIMEKIFEDLSFNAPNMRGQKFEISADHINDKLANIIEDEDLSKFIL